jgi:hypothetical protein
LLTNVNQPLTFLLRIRTGSAYLHGLIAAGSITSLTALRSLLMIVRAAGWLAEVITCNLQMSESYGDGPRSQRSDQGCEGPVAALWLIVLRAFGSYCRSDWICRPYPAGKPREILE